MNRIRRGLALLLLLPLLAVPGSAAARGCDVADLVTIKTEIFVGGEWQDISPDVRNSDPVRIRRGIGNEGGRADPGSLTLTVNNGRSKVNPDVTGRYSPRNPRSDLYGLLGLGTPIRVSAGLSPDDLSVRAVMEITRLPIRWDRSGNNVWGPIEASGILRRLGLPGSPLADPITRFALANNVAAYWPMSDPEGSRDARSGIPGGRPMRLMAPLDSSTPRPLPEFGRGFLGDHLPPAARTTGAAVIGNPTFSGWEGRVGSAAGEFAVDLMLRADEPRVGEDDLPHKITLVVLDAGDDAEGWALTLNAALGSLTLGHSTAGGVADEDVNVWDGQTHHIRVHVSQATSTTASWQVYIDGELLDSGVDSIGREVFGVNRVLLIWESVVTVPPQVVPMTVGFVHVWGPGPPDIADTYAAASGHAGETAGRRVERLCGEEGVTLATVGDLEATTRMGPQSSAAFLDLLDEAADAEAAGAPLPILTETRDALGLTFRTRASMYIPVT